MSLQYTGTQIEEAWPSQGAEDDKGGGVESGHHLQAARHQGELDQGDGEHEQR